MSKYAPEYTTRERWIIAGKLAAILIPMFLIIEFWFKGWLNSIASKAHCYYYGPFSGLELLIYGVFVFMPLSFIGVILLLEGKRSFKIIKTGQNPLPGEKVLRRTRYKYGKAALYQPVAMLIIVLLLLVMSIWGSFQVTKFMQGIAPCDAPEIRR